LTDAAGVETALLVSAALMFASPLLGLWLTMPPVRRPERRRGKCSPIRKCVVADATQRAAGVEIDTASPRKTPVPFHGVMQEVQLSRQRNGAYGWSIARDIADPELWTEPIIARPGSTICASAIARPNPSARCINARLIFTSGPIRCASAACWSGRFGSVRWKERYARPRRQRGVAGRNGGGQAAVRDPARGATARYRSEPFRRPC